MVGPVIAITLGDGAGIGPEIVEEFFTHKKHQDFYPLIIGPSVLLPGLIRHPVQFTLIEEPAWNKLAKKITPGKPNGYSGELSFRILQKATELTAAKYARALVTLPIAKYAWRAAKIKYNGHTEFFADYFHCRPTMIMANKKMLLALSTVHLALKEVSKKITVDQISRTITTTTEFLKKYCQIPRPKILVFALNPHAGEKGLLGKDEEKIASAIKSLDRKYRIFGPVAADAAALALLKKRYDAGIVMYHDQALIALKISSPETTVNITAGLPIIRTAPGHGTATDIVGKQPADLRPFQSALVWANKLCRRQ